MANLISHSILTTQKANCRKKKFNLVLFPDDKMGSEPVTSSHCGHPEMWGIDKKSGSCEKVSLTGGKASITLKLKSLKLQSLSEI